MTSTASPSDRFLSAWEAAGRPPVKKLVYPRDGSDVPARVLFSHSEIELWAGGDALTFSDDGGVAKLSWTYRTGSLVDADGSAEIYFDRADPIRSGRRPEVNP